MAENAFSWSITASSNDVADPAVPWPEGMLPGAVNNSARATMAGVARFIADLNGTITTGGTAGSYTITSNSGHTALTNGILVTAKAHATNTAAATSNFNALGAKSIRVMASGAEAPIAAGQMVIGGTYQFRYDTAANSAAGAWMLLNPEPDPTTQVTIGKILLHTTDALPTNFLWCNGALVSRTTYAALFTEIGINFGSGDGSTTFQLPDMCGRAPFGTDDMGAISAKNRITSAGSGINGTLLGTSGGAETITLDSTMIPSHTHSVNINTSNSGSTHTHTFTTDSGGVDHTHTVAPGTPAQSNGTFTGPGGTGWGGAVGTATTSGASAFSHTHTGTTTTANADHFHNVSGITLPTGSGLLHNNMPPAFLVNFIIRAL